MSTEFDLTEIPERTQDEIQVFADGLITEGNLVSARIGQDLRRMKATLFNRSDWAANEDPMATLQAHVDAMGVKGVVMFSGSGFQSRIAAVLKRLPKDDPATAIQVLEGAKQALNAFLEQLDPDYESDPDIVPPVDYTVDTSGGMPRIVFAEGQEYPGPETE